MVRSFSNAGAVARLVLLLPVAVYADEPVRDHDITVEDYATVAVISDCAMSPDGAHVVYVDLRWDESTDKRNADLWAVPTGGGEARRLTFDPASDSWPQWSPDGEWIYFTSSRERAGEDKPPYNGKMQVWRVAVDGLEPMPVTRFEEGLSGYELSKDGQTLYYLIHRDQEDDEWKDLRAKHKDLIDFAHGTRQV
ncbi:MAG: TolB family protein, partial [Phycisphaerae bacterium]